MDRRGPALHATDLDLLEGELKSPLPRDYREFLLTYNGGAPTPDVIDILGFDESPTDVQIFFGVGRTIESSCIRWNLEVLSGRLTRGVVPIARDSGGNVFGLSLLTGTISYYDLDSVYGDLVATPKCYWVAPEFNSFVSRLRADSA